VFPETIVVPLDGSDFAAKAVPVAAGLMRRREGRIVLVTAHGEEDVVASQEYLDEVAAAVWGVDVRALVVADRPAVDAIRSVAAEEPGPMVCMTTHGRGRLRWAILGSVTERVIHESTGAVLVVGRHCPTDPPPFTTRLLLCVDGSTAEPPVLAEALDWARALDLEVVVATVIHPLDPNAPEDVLAGVAERFAAEGGRARTEIIRSSYPAGALADAATELDIGLMAMSSHVRAGVARLALGSVTMGAVNLARCPVLVARPW
jgi:nucleotide-binding universal stress UspA family protein